MSRQYDELVLAIYPTARGIAYTLFQAPLSPVDWGIKRVRGQSRNANARCLEIVAKLCKSLRPDTIVLEAIDPNKSNKSERLVRLHALIVAYCEAENLTLARYSRQRVQDTFREAGAITRYEIAHAIATYIPAFAHRKPPIRKPWQTEDQRLSLFDAAALALTHYAFVPVEEPP